MRIRSPPFRCGQPASPDSALPTAARAPRSPRVKSLELTPDRSLCSYKLMFDKGHRVLLEVERNLLFLIIDLLMFVTLLALLLDAKGSPVLSVQKWAVAFSAFTLNGSPAGYDWARTVGVLGAVGG